MDLKARLGRLQVQAGVKTAAPAVSRDRISALRSRLARLPATRVHAPTHPGVPAMSNESLAEAMRGEVLAEGLIQVRQRVPLTGRHGRIALEILQHTQRLPIEVENDSRRVYLDTETTGLSGGSGTVAFLIGLAIVSKEAIELTQLLMTQFSSEAALLRAVNGMLTPDDYLVSYNGKSYDIPLLQTRYRMQGLPHPFTSLPHLDLVHPVRRLFGQCWSDCRLMTLEKQLLGFQRVDDLPGSEAPEAWFAYLRQGEGRNLIRVVQHNAQDILSLAVAHHTVAAAIQQPEKHGVDIDALARWLAEHREADALNVLTTYRHTLSDASLRLLAELHRREARWSDAVPLWEQLAGRGCVTSLERLAKFHEHVSKDLAAAWHYCQQLPVGEDHHLRRQRVGEKLARGRKLFDVEDL